MRRACRGRTASVIQFSSTTDQRTPTLITAWNTLARGGVGSAAASAERVRVRQLDADRESRFCPRTPHLNSRFASWTLPRELHSPICTASTAYAHVGSPLVAACSCFIGISALAMGGIKGTGSGVGGMGRVGSRERGFLFSRGRSSSRSSYTIERFTGSIKETASRSAGSLSRRRMFTYATSQREICVGGIRLSGHMREEGYPQRLEVYDRGLALRRRSSSRSSYTIERFAGSIKETASRSAGSLSRRCMFTYATSQREICVGGIRLSGHMSGEGYSQRSLVFGMCES